MTLYKFLDAYGLCLRVRRSPGTLKSFSTSIEDVWLVEGSSGIHFYGYGKTYEESVRDYVSKIEGKKLRHIITESLNKEIHVPDNLIA